MVRRLILPCIILSILTLVFSPNSFAQYHKKFNPSISDVPSKVNEKVTAKLLETVKSIGIQKENKIQFYSPGQVDSVFYTGWESSKTVNTISSTVEKRRLYNHDYENNLVTRIESDYNTSTGEYENATKTESHYGSVLGANIDRETVYNWDSDQKDWIPDHEYDFTDNYTEKTELYSEYQDGQKVPVWQTIDKYTDEGHTEKLHQEYDNGVWKNKNRTLYEHDGPFIVGEIQQIWNENTNDWENVEKEEITYEDNYEASFTTYYWDGNDWVNEIYGEHDYNEDDNVSRTTISYWSGGEWQYLARTIYSYLDPSGTIQSLIDMYWDNVQQAWQSNWRSYYSYNSDYQLTQDLLEQWNGSDWDYFSRLQYNYDADGNCVNGNADMYYGGNWEDTFSTLSFQDGYGLYHYFLCSYFNAFFSGLTDVKEKEVRHSFNLEQNYPNPFNPTTSIQYRVPSIEKVSLKVYDILGRELKTLVNEVKAAGNYKITFNASDLPSGVYFYTLRSGDYRDTKKMVLLR